MALNRRIFLGTAAAACALPLLPAQAAAPLVATPGQAEGPFYPVRLPADADHDLVRVEGAAARAMGTVAHVEGRVVDLAGRPLAGAVVEIWQCDAQGVYRHPRAPDQARFDDGFQGYGHAAVAADGGYRFRTIRPVPYPGRTPHIHFAVIRPDGRRFVTQMYVAGEPLNARDGLLQSIRDPARRRAVLVELSPAEGREPGALRGRFDIVLEA